MREGLTPADEPEPNPENLPPPLHIRPSPADITLGASEEDEALADGSEPTQPAPGVFAEVPEELLGEEPAVGDALPSADEIAETDVTHRPPTPFYITAGEVEPPLAMAESPENPPELHPELFDPHDFDHEYPRDPEQAAALQEELLEVVREAMETNADYVRLMTMPGNKPPAQELLMEYTAPSGRVAHVDMRLYRDVLPELQIREADHANIHAYVTKWGGPHRVDYDVDRAALTLPKEGEVTASTRQEIRHQKIMDEQPNFSLGYKLGMYHEVGPREMGRALGIARLSEPRTESYKYLSAVLVNRLRPLLGPGGEIIAFTGGAEEADSRQGAVRLSEVISLQLKGRGYDTDQPGPVTLEIRLRQSQGRGDLLVHAGLGGEGLAQRTAYARIWHDWPVSAKWIERHMSPQHRPLVEAAGVNRAATQLGYAVKGGLLVCSRARMFYDSTGREILRFGPVSTLGDETEAELLHRFLRKPRIR